MLNQMLTSVAKRRYLGGSSSPEAKKRSYKHRFSDNAKVGESEGMTFTGRIGGSFNRVSRGLGIVLIIQAVVFITVLIKPQFFIPEEDTAFQDVIHESIEGDIRDMPEWRFMGDRRAYQPDPGRDRKERRVRSHESRREHVSFTHRSSRPPFGTQPSLVLQQPTATPSKSTAAVKNDSMSGKISRDLDHLTHKEDEAIVKHVTKEGPVKWEVLRQDINARRIENALKAKPKQSMPYHNLTVRDLRLRWERVLRAQQDPSLKLHRRPNERNSDPDSSVKQWGWGEKGQIRRISDDEIDAVSMLASLASSLPNSAGSKSEPDSDLTNLPAEAAALRATANAVLTAAEAHVDCSHLIPAAGLGIRIHCWLFCRQWGYRLL